MIYIQNLKHLIPSKIVLIGASTGGPGHIQKIISELSDLNNTSIVIAQHMMPSFIPSFTKSLHKNAQIAKNNTILDLNSVYVCSNNTYVELNHDNKLQFMQTLSTENKYNPNINLLFNSFVPFAKDIKILGVILTGIGDDGVMGCKQLSLNGARSITESKKSAIVDGMTGRAREEIKNIEIMDMEDIVLKIKDFCN